MSEKITKNPNFKVMVVLNERQYKQLQESEELGLSLSERLRNSFVLYKSKK